MVLKEKHKEGAGRPVIFGYYRFTDIFFEWWGPLDTQLETKSLIVCRHKTLPNPEDISPLEASISYDAWVYPDHPLRNGRKDGIELHIG